MAVHSGGAAFASATEIEAITALSKVVATWVGNTKGELLVDPIRLRDGEGSLVAEINPLNGVVVFARVVAPSLER